MRLRSLSILLVIVLLSAALSACGRGGSKPTVVIESPSNDYEVSDGQTLTVEVSAQGGGNIERVELSVDGALGDVSTNPLPEAVFRTHLEWAASGVGRHTLQVKAYNTSGLASDPVAVVVSVVQGIALVTPIVGVGPFVTPSPAPPTATSTNTPVPPTATPTRAVPTPTPTSQPPTATATTLPAPVLNLWADPGTVNQGQPFTLHWHEDYASAIYLSGPEVGSDVGIGGPDGSMTICSGGVGCPGAGDQTYSLRGVGTGGETVKSTVVHINAPPPPADFQAGYVGWGLCDSDPNVVYSIHNTGALALESISMEVEGPVGTLLNFGSMNRPFRLAPTLAYPDCAPPNEGAERLDPGAEGWIWFSVAPPPTGQGGRAWILGCTADDLDGSCKELIIDYTY